MKRMTEEKRITEFFGCNVFGDEVMRRYLSPDAYAELKDVIDNNKPLGKALASVVAEAMKNWAIEHGVTHYTHWFQPLNGTTAEKHDSFISIDENGNTILEFTGKNLMKGETDASSFPSGGIRATFEARGYTVWDCSSPAFIKKSQNGAGILYIPTAFCSYTGEALDKKTPLLRSMEALNTQAKKLLSLLGKPAQRVFANVGGEQEYFLIDKSDFMARSDLKMTGRTLYGKAGEYNTNQYYGTIKERVSDFMADLNEELWKLGITAKTQHNEVAPCQHELAPIYCTANIATDQNQLIMETMKTIAERHHLACLLHEKPFAAIAGSGKHNNWSLTTKTENLLRPSKEPGNNETFLLFFTAVIAAVDEYADLIRMSASNPGNEYRLGGDEAPPDIISVFTGEAIYNILEHVASGASGEELVKKKMNTGLSYLPEYSRDDSDRNRTSPFAFTGNKFEFRMVGSSATLSNPNTTLNTVVAEMLSRMSQDMEEALKRLPVKEAAREVFKKYWNAHKRVVFNGNNYSAAWRKEAERRGLIPLKSAVEAYNTLLLDKNIEVFQKHGVMSEKEMTSRREIYLENFYTTIFAEADVMVSMGYQQILPTAQKRLSRLAEGIAAAKAAELPYTALQDAYLKTYEKTTEFTQVLSVLQKSLALGITRKDAQEKATYARYTLMADMDRARTVECELETFLPKNALPFPSYEDILFYN